jgi:hypothetical protein
VQRIKHRHAVRAFIQAGVANGAEEEEEDEEEEEEEEGG